MLFAYLYEYAVHIYMYTRICVRACVWYEYLHMDVYVYLEVNY